MAAPVTSPLSIPTEDTRLRDLYRAIQSGGAKIIAPAGEGILIPTALQELLLVILKNLQSGNAISIVCERQQLTTQRAAGILGVSRPFLVGLLEGGAIPFHMVGRHRRVYLNDLLAYKQRRDAARHEAIDNMARSEIEAGTYDRVVLPDGAEEE